MPWIAAHLATCSFWSSLRQRARLVCTSWSLFLFLKKVLITFLLACTTADAGTSLERCPDGCSCCSLRNRAEISTKIRHQRSSSNNSSEIDRTKAYVCYIRVKSLVPFTVLVRRSTSDANRCGASLRKRHFCNACTHARFPCDSVHASAAVELRPVEGFTKQRASVDIRHLNVTSPVVIN